MVVDVVRPESPALLTEVLDGVAIDGDDVAPHVLRRRLAGRRHLRRGGAGQQARRDEGQLVMHDVYLLDYGRTLSIRSNGSIVQSTERGLEASKCTVRVVSVTPWRLLAPSSRSPSGSPTGPTSRCSRSWRRAGCRSSPPFPRWAPRALPRAGIRFKAGRLRRGCVPVTGSQVRATCTSVSRGCSSQMHWCTWSGW